MEKIRIFIQYFMYVFVLIIAFGVMLVNNRVNNIQNSNSHFKEYSYPIDCMREAELSYWENKYLLTLEVQNYINSVTPYSNLRGYAIVDECEDYDVDIIFVLTQAQLESHFGTKGIGSKINNVFNVGVFDGLSSDKVNKHYKFNYPNQSIKPYLELLTTKYLVNKTEHDLMSKYVDTNGKRYASDPDYESKFKSKYEHIKNTTKIDSLQLVMKSYALKCNR